ncbi:hypothetical protein Q5752_006798 [Cryptotrichosporon argae]
MDNIEDLTHHETDASVAAAAAAVAAQQFHFPHHHLQQPDFGQVHKDDDGVGHHHVHHDDVDVHALEIPVNEHDDVGLHDPDADLDLQLSGIESPHVDTPGRSAFGRPPSIRKACDLCHAAKQKCSGERPTCTRCLQGGWQCNYAPRQRRRTVPKEQKAELEARRAAHAQAHGHAFSVSAQNAKKRKLAQRDSLAHLATEAMEMRAAMGLTVDLGLPEEEDDEQLMTLSDDQMLESIAIDGYLADLPLDIFVRNLPYTAAQTNTTANVNFNPDDFPTGTDNPYSAEMDQHTTSALRDAIFSLNESNNAGHAHEQASGEGEAGDGQALEGMGENGIDPHLALLDLSHMPNEDGTPGAGDNGDGGAVGVGVGDLHLGALGGPTPYPPPAACSHMALVPHVLALLMQHTLEPKPGSDSPLNAFVFPPLARALRLFHALVQCPHCAGAPQQTLPQLALLSRTTTILTFRAPPAPLLPNGQPSAQLTVHGAKLTGTGISEAIEAHIVGVVWDSWRASVRELFAAIERKAQEVIAQSTIPVPGDQTSSSSVETQRAGLMFQAATRLITAMDEVEGV